MKKAEFLQKLEAALEIEPGKIDGNETLADLDYWDSLAELSFMALADQELQVTITSNQISNSKTIKELLALLGEHLQD